MSNATIEFAQLMLVDHEQLLKECDLKAEPYTSDTRASNQPLVTVSRLNGEPVNVVNVRELGTFLEGYKHGLGAGEPLPETEPSAALLRLMRAYKEGYDERVKYKNLANYPASTTITCPYAARTPEVKAWRNGWSDA